MESIISPEQLNTLIRNRRSVFPQDYTGESVDDDIVRQILENARWAPTHKVTEPWRFVVFTGDGIKTFAKFQSDLYRKVTEADGSFKERNYLNLLTKPAMSSHVIVVIMKRDERKSLPEIEEAGAVFCAVQNMYLTASAYGVGCYLSTGGVTYFEETKSFFGLEAEDRIIGFFYIGVPKRINSTSRRKPLAELSEWVTTAETPDA